jgi:hypothetical protein
VLKPDSSERLTLAEQLRLLVSQGVPEEDAKTRLGKVFRLKEIIYRPNYAMSYENASINWETGQVSVRRLSRRPFTPTLTAPELFAHFQEGAPFPHWDDLAWDHPVTLLDAIRLWSPHFSRRLDQVRWRSPNEIPMLLQQHQPARKACRTAETAPEAAEIPGSLSDDFARLLREWDIWDDNDRLVNAWELAGRLIIEKTRQGGPCILKCAPPAPSGGLGEDDQHVGEAWHDELGPYDFDLPNSMFRRPGGDWLPARILGGIEAEGERRRVTRLARERQDAAAATAWAAELRKPFRERNLFGIFEIAEHLTRRNVLELDDAKRNLIVLDLDDKTSRQEFDLSGESDVVIKLTEPPYFRALGPAEIVSVPTELEALRIHNAQSLYLRRSACRRYIEANLSLENAPRLLREWFPETLTPREKSSIADEYEPRGTLYADISLLEKAPGTSRQRAAYRSALERWMARHDLPLLQKLGATAISREFKSHCEQHLPGVVSLLPKRLRSMENVIESIITRRIKGARHKHHGPKPAGKPQQSPLRIIKSR